MTKKKRKKKRSGISLLLLAAALALPVMADKKPGAETYFLLAGSVFREPGFALPNAEVTVVPDSEVGARAPKIKKPQTVSDSRGEFALRLPPGNMRYIVKVHAKGFHDEEKTITVQGEDRMDVTFLLHAESK